MYNIEFYEDKNGKSEVYEYKFVLLSVFMKKTQKTPQTEIEKAKRLLDDYKKGVGYDG